MESQVYKPLSTEQTQERYYQRTLGKQLLTYWETISSVLISGLTLACLFLLLYILCALLSPLLSMTTLKNTLQSSNETLSKLQSSTTNHSQEESPQSTSDYVAKETETSLLASQPIPLQSKNGPSVLAEDAATGIHLRSDAEVLGPSIFGDSEETEWDSQTSEETDPGNGIQTETALQTSNETTMEETNKPSAPSYNITLKENAVQSVKLDERNIVPHANSAEHNNYGSYITKRNYGSSYVRQYNQPYRTYRRY